MTIALTGLVVADPPQSWRAVGFAVDPDGSCRIGPVRVRLAGPDAGRGATGWGFTVSGAEIGDLVAKPAEVDGIPTEWREPGDPLVAGTTTSVLGHPNGATGIDHVVVLTPDLRRTVAALEQIGLDVRRERDGELGGRAMRQVFFRAGEVVIEVVGDPEAAAPGPASVWGLTHAVVDIDATAAFLGDRVGRVKDAVQPRRRITTLRHRDAGVSVATAFISAAPPPAKR